MQSRQTGLFITGTDTDVGKTLTSALLVSALRHFGFEAGYYKPIQTGSDSDSLTVAGLTALNGPFNPSPTYSFQQPQAPLRAAMAENKAIDLSTVQDHWRKLQTNPAVHWIIEGAGGILVPLTPTQTTRDLMSLLDVPGVIVASTRLGTINHTLLTTEAAKKAGIRLRGIILSGEPEPGLADILERFSRIPVIAQIPHLPSISGGQIQELAPVIFPRATLENLFVKSVAGSTP